jgi:hypothetical protein
LLSKHKNLKMLLGIIFETPNQIQKKGATYDDKRIDD